MEKILDYIRREPSRIVGFVLAVVGVCTAFGLGLTQAQQSAIVAIVGAALALLGAEVTRSQVSPKHHR